MRLLPIRGSSVLPLLVGGLILAGCSREPTEQQKAADATLLQAKIALERGEYRNAQGLLNSALNQDQALGRGSRVAEELRLLGTMMRATASFDSSVQYFNRSIEEYRNVADRPGARRVMLDIGSTFRLMGEERKAYDAYAEALRLARVFNDQDGIQEIQWAMLPACRSLRERDDERKMLAELEQSALAAKDIRRQARVLQEAGRGQSAAGEPDTAAVSFRRALTLIGTGDALLMLDVMLDLARAYTAAGKMREAFETYGEAIRRSENVKGTQPIRVELFMRVGNAYLRSRRYAEAVRFYRAALKASTAAGNRIAEGYAAIHIAHCDMETNRDAALPEYRSALDLFRSLEYGRGTAYAHLALGIAYQRSGQFTEAYKNFKAALDLQPPVPIPGSSDDLLSDCERAAVGTGSFPVDDAMLDLLLQAGRYDEAFGVLERRNERGLQATLNAFAPVVRDVAMDGALSRYAAARAWYTGTVRQMELALWEGTLSKDQHTLLRAALEREGKRVRETADAALKISRSFAPMVRPAPLAISAVQNALAPGVAVVAYVATPRSLYAFVVKRGEAAVEIAAVGRDSVVSRTMQLLALLRRREMKVDTTQTGVAWTDRRTRELTASLFGDCIRPIEARIAGTTKLVAVFAEGLPVVPLHLLRRGGLPGNPFVAESHLVTYLPLLQALFLNTLPLAPVADVIGVGYSGSTDWDVEYELRDIRAFYKDARMFFNQQACLTTLQTEKADLLHLAAEFHYDAEAIGNSWVRLSDGKSATGSRRVPLGELCTINPFATVIVSDLASDRLTMMPAEPYLYLANRTATLITNGYTPWRKTKKVFDEAFYTALLQGGTTPGAFWRAQLEMMKNPDTSIPASWGVYFLWGK
jgi:tetratricopeptide (TPR) repeat protein